MQEFRHKKRETSIVSLLYTLIQNLYYSIFIQFFLFCRILPVLNLSLWGDSLKVVNPSNILLQWEGETCFAYARSPWLITKPHDDKLWLRTKWSNVRKAVASQSKLKSILFFLNLDATADKVILTMTESKTKKTSPKEVFCHPRIII